MKKYTIRYVIPNGAGQALRYAETIEATKTYRSGDSFVFNLNDELLKIVSLRFIQSIDVSPIEDI